VGGGLAGLGAASELAQRGFEVVLFEREERPGGRARSACEKGFRFEPGAHAIASTDRRLLDLVARAGLAGELLPLRPLALAQVEGGRLLRIDPARSRGAASIPGVGRLAGRRLARLPRLLARFSGVLDAEAPERAAAQDDRSAADFARLYLGSRLLERWIAPWLTDTFLCDPDETSRVLALALLAFRRHAHLGNLRGDLGRVAEALAGSLDARCGVAVGSIEPGAGARLVVHHAGSRGEGSFEADAVVVALPPADTLAAAAPLLESAERDVLRGRRGIPALGLALGLDGPLAHHATRVRIPRREGLPFQVLVLEPGVPGGRLPEGRGLAVLLAAGVEPRALDVSDERVASAWIAALDALLPGSAARVAWIHVHRWVSAFPDFPVGSFRALARLRHVGSAARARGRRLYLAGDHLVGPSLEGAAASGRRAAAALAADLTELRGRSTETRT
jgi:protoporphyrinogen oxidase